MPILPEPLKPMESYAQFILFKLVPRADGKVDKLPVDPRTCEVFLKGSDWQQDPTAWTTHSNAATLSNTLGPEYGVGFLFTPNDPFFFVDIDGCVTGVSLSPTGSALMASLPGAAVEVSQSGTGLHIFGQYSGPPPDHSCKNTPLGLELYTEGRFAALTGDRAIGSAGVDCTAALAGVVAMYYPPKERSQIGWTTEPVPEYTGPEDDKELIKKALAAKKSTAATFGGASSFAALWEGDEDALAVSYPDQFKDRPYDDSNADAALAQHLAFWTGKNCERMLRIMQESALVRDKWERDGYLEITIQNAVSLQKTVYSIEVGDATLHPTMVGTKAQVEFAAGIIARKISECAGDAEKIAALSVTTGRLADANFWINSKDKTPDELITLAKPIEGGADPFENIEGPEITAGFQFLGPEQQIGFFHGCVYIQDIHRVFTPSGALLKSDQFNATYGGYVFQIEDSGAKTTRKPFEAFTESQVVRYPKAETSCFRPMMAPGTLVKQEGRVLVNTYIPVITPRIKGDASRFLAHLAKVLPNENDRRILLSYMAACVQHLGVKFQWAPLLQGAPGNGKSFFTRCLVAALGEKYTHMPKSKEIDEKFNGWLFGKVFIGVEDVYVPHQKRDLMEILKPMITESRLACREMQTDQIMRDVCCNFLFNSNYKDALPKTHDDRRLSIFYTAQQSATDIVRDGMGGDYFPDLYDWFWADGGAIITDYLHCYEISDELNPATGCHRSPETSTTAEAIVASLGGIEQEVIEAIEEGRPGFAGGWVSSMAFDNLLRNKRMDGKIPINKRRDLLKALGYEWHPMLGGGRVNNMVTPDNGKPRLFVKMDSALVNLPSGKAVADAYQAAQNGTYNRVAEVFGNGSGQ